MADAKVTCRYCNSEEVDQVPTEVGPVPLCERHAADLAARRVNQLDTLMGIPVHNEKLPDQKPPADKAQF